MNNYGRFKNRSNNLCTQFFLVSKYFEKEVYKAHLCTNTSILIP